MLLENRAVTAAGGRGREGPTWASPGTATSTDASSSTSAGAFVEGYYLVGLLAERALRRHPGGVIVHDPRLVWNTEEIVLEHGRRRPVLSKSGHAFIKEKMRDVDGVYGGEMSAHHYFKEFSYCDSGMIPWLQVAEAVSEEGRPLSAMVEERIARYPVSGEINLTLTDPARAIAAARARYAGEALSIDETDGVSVELAEWRFNVQIVQHRARRPAERGGSRRQDSSRSRRPKKCSMSWRGRVRIALAQINPTVGDIKGNARADHRLGGAARRPRGAGWWCSPSWPSPAIHPRIWS